MLDTDIFVNFLRDREEEANFFYRAVVLGEFSACYSSINELELSAARHLDSEQERAINELLAVMQRLDMSAAVSRLAGRLLEHKVLCLYSRLTALYPGNLQW